MKAEANKCCLSFRKFYGQEIQEFVQGPGETVYMPGTIAHAVHNLVGTVSVTENIFLMDCIEDYILGFVVVSPSEKQRKKAARGRVR